MVIKLFERTAGLLLICLFFLVTGLFAQGKEKRLLDYRVHKNGKLWVGVTNFGQFGTDRGRGAVWPGSDLPGHEPQYINRGGIFIGGIVPSDQTVGPDLNDPGDLDTLVSEGPTAWSSCDFNEMYAHYPDQRSAIQVRSTLMSSEFYHQDAVSEEDFISVYCDTFLLRNDYSWMRDKHQRPLGIEVIEKSYQFSLPFAEDIVFFDLVVRNIGKNVIRNVYIGFFADNDMGEAGSVNQRDDASGFMDVNSTGDVVNTAWVVEPDGDEGRMAGVVGVRVLRPTEKDGFVSFNWWMSDSEVSTKDDWGPITPNVYTGDLNANDPIGSPEYDTDKYLLMSNGSFDSPQFDPVTKEFDPNIPAGAAPNDNSRFMISFGPLGASETTITDPNDKMNGQTVKIFEPGDSILFTYAVIGGEGDPAVAQSLESFDPASFEDLGINAFMAGIMFDNPGVDTDEDGYAGEDLDGDGVIDTGDGIPDFKGPPPPPSPLLTVKPGDHTITLDWSAADPNCSNYDPSCGDPLNFQDPFISDDPTTPEDESKDFEGFRVLRSTTGILGSFEVLAEYDLADNEMGRNTGLQFNYIDHVPNGIEYYYAVVSFDRGAPSFGIETLASSPLGNLTKMAASLTPSENFSDKPVWVEPNPYIERGGFEDPVFFTDRQIENFRIIDFVNVPSPCTIRIFTVDGDLVASFEHENPNSSRARWDVKSRNNRPIASGLYIFAVEANGDTQVGRFLVIK